MTVEEIIKQGYAYGASVALQQAGLQEAEANNAAVKLAEDVSGMHPALGSLLEKPPQQPQTPEAYGALSRALLSR